MFKKIFDSEILFTGYYGQLNTGDDAFVAVADWGARRYWNKNNNKFLAIKKNLPEVSGVKGYPFSIPRTYSSQNKLLISNTNYLISAGGSTIHSALLKNNIKQLALNEKRNGSKIKIGGIGVSIGPFKTSKDEKKLAKKVNIPSNEQIICMIPIGIAMDDFHVTLSQRRSVEEVLKVIHTHE